MPEGENAATDWPYLPRRRAEVFSLSLQSIAAVQEYEDANTMAAQRMIGMRLQTGAAQGRPWYLRQALATVVGHKTIRELKEVLF